MDIKAHDDHERYLNRMTESLHKSTKSLIPLYVADRNTILDVGCADGALISVLENTYKNKYILGIDVCKESIDICKKKRIRAIKEDIQEFADKTDMRFDCIIFSSVMHEIASYASSNKYSVKHIKKALSNAKRILSDDGVIILRDGIGTNSNKLVKFSFINNDDVKFIEKFIKTSIYSGSPVIIDKNTKDKYTIQMSIRDFKEFCFTYTWGEKSWERESQERFGILTIDEWIDTVNQCGLNIKMMNTSSEQYIEKLSEKIECNNIDSILSMCTVTMVIGNNNYK